jgi:hypothetical protein
MCTVSQCRILQMALYLRVRIFLQMGGKRGRDYRGRERMGCGVRSRYRRARVTLVSSAGLACAKCMRCVKGSHEDGSRPSDVIKVPILILCMSTKTRYNADRGANCTIKLPPVCMRCKCCKTPPNNAVCLNQ